VWPGFGPACRRKEKKVAEYIVDPVLSSDAVSFDEALAKATRISAGFNRDANIYKLVGTISLER